MKKKKSKKSKKSKLFDTFKTFKLISKKQLFLILLVWMLFFSLFFFSDIIVFRVIIAVCSVSALPLFLSLAVIDKVKS